MNAWILRLWILLSGLALVARADAPGTIYFSVGSDTAVWNWPGGVNIFVHTNHFSPSLYNDPAGRAYQVMRPEFRARFRDSYGTPLKMTWWMLVGSVYGVTDNHDVPIPNLMPLYLMRKYHGEALRAAGDELTLHYHNFLWSDYSGAGTYYWNQAKTFHEQRADFDKAVAQSLIEEEVFTVTFRSGWHYMDNEWQNYANQLWPYNMDNDSPLKSGPLVQPFFNVLDWSQAPTDFVPFHPATTNYQVPGDGIGWNVHSVKMPNVGQPLIDSIFAAAEAGTNQVVSLWAHLPEYDFLDQIARMDLLIHVASTIHPAIQFRYCTAVEAMQHWRGTHDATPPVLTVTETTNSDAVTLHLKTDEPIHQPVPFIALKDISENYRIINCTPDGSNAWTAELPLPKSSIAKLGIAVTDPAGNLTTRILRYLPDDAFVDNLDPGYSETSGTWTNSTTAAWGIDARVARLGSGEPASALWILPVTEARPYKVSIQIPMLTNALASQFYSIESGGRILYSSYLPNSAPADQWIDLATLPLDPGSTNLLRLAASGATLGESSAAADVVKLTPLILPHDFIGSIQVDPGATTANIVWSTADPGTGIAEYGEDIRYGRETVLQVDPTTNHVVTLTGLSPGTLYQYQLVSQSGGYSYTAQGQFMTTVLPESAPVAEVPVFGLTQQWSYSTNNLDHIPWQQPGFDDGSWPVGTGLLWVDSRGYGISSGIEPVGSEMPSNPATKFPYTTYYLRTRFTLANHRPVGELVFTNYIDDGAAFYLDGVEIHRHNLPLPPVVITNSTLATALNCSGDATCPVVFRVGADMATNVLAGKHVLAVEVHNFTAKSADITFGSALSYFEMPNTDPVLKALRSDGSVTFYWNEEGYALQQASRLNGAGDWVDVRPSGVGSPWKVTPTGSQFFRLVGK